MYRSERFWNILSTSYDKNAIDKAYYLIIEKSKKYFTPDDVVLDFSCATGLYSIRMSGYVREIQAFDTAQKMIDIAKTKAKSNGITNVTFSRTTIFDKKYKENTFDVVLGLNILLYFKDESEILIRMNRLTKIGGIIILSTACLKETRSYVGVLSACLIYVLRSLRILPYLKFYKIRELEETISNCGFKIIETDVLIDKPATEYFIVARKL